MSRAAAGTGVRAATTGSFRGAAFVVVLLIGLGLRLWHLGASPAWQWDEAVYYRVSVNVQHGLLNEHLLVGLQGAVPVSATVLLPGLVALVQPGRGQHLSRPDLGVILTALMQTVLFRLLWKIHGPTVALFAILPVVFDGWLMYIERVSYIENALMLLIVTGFLLYQRALENPSWHRFAVAGAGHRIRRRASSRQALTCCSPTLLCWLVLRRAHKGHLVLLGVAIAVFATYLAVMIGPVRRAWPRLVHRPVDHPAPAGPGFAAQRRHADLPSRRPASAGRPVPVLHPERAGRAGCFLVRSCTASCSATGHATGRPPRKTRCCSAGWSPAWSSSGSARLSSRSISP